MLTNRYIAAVEIACPWILRYIAVIAMNQGRQGRMVLKTIAEIMNRFEGKMDDPVLLFIYHLVSNMDLITAAQEFKHCEDVFASDFFLAARGQSFENVDFELRFNGIDVHGELPFINA